MLELAKVGEEGESERRDREVSKVANAPALAKQLGGLMVVGGQATGEYVFILCCPGGVVPVERSSGACARASPPSDLTLSLAYT